jgi:hypothetical protein
MTRPAELMDETIEVTSPEPPLFFTPGPSMLTLQFCTLVVEQALLFLNNLSSLDRPATASTLTTKEVFERKSQILPNSAIGKHLKYSAKSNKR